MRVTDERAKPLVAVGGIAICFRKLLILISRNNDHILSATSVPRSGSRRQGLCNNRGMSRFQQHGGKGTSVRLDQRVGTTALQQALPISQLRSRRRPRL